VAAANPNWRSVLALMHYLLDTNLCNSSSAPGTTCIMSSGASMTKAQREDLIRLIASPPAGSKIADAKDFGIDLTLLIRTLEMTPTERLQQLTAVQAFFQELRSAMKTATHG